MATAGKPAASMPPSAAPFSADHSLDLVFSSGNPRIEATRVVVVFYPDPPAGSSFHLPVGRKPRVCVLGVPNHMTYDELCRFCGDFVHGTLSMRAFRTDGDCYSVLINFDTQCSTDNFYKHFNGKQFSSLEEYVCCVRYVEDVQYMQSFKPHSSVMCLAEQHRCPTCLEQLDQDRGGVLTTICNHSFHYQCISKWTDTLCPVCRYRQQPDKPICSICGAPESLWMCLLCGHIGCGRHKDGHAVRHWEETHHSNSLELETKKVWDYAGNNYVHRLIQSKKDAELVDCHAGTSETLMNSICESVVKEYNDFLRSQFERQRDYNESLLLEVREEDEKEISAATEQAMRTKFQKLQTSLDKVVEDKDILDQLNDHLIKDEDKWKQKLQDLKARWEASLKLKDEKIEKLKRERDDLIAQLVGQDDVGVAPAHHSFSSDMQGGTSTSLPVAPEVSSSSVRDKKKGKLK
ncbi:unnamed protein product [Urochloa humidicola]